MQENRKLEISESIKRGWNPIPIKANSKIPCVGWKDYQNKLLTESEALNLFTRFDNPNIGIITGSVSALLVLDVDANHDGFQSLKDLEEKYGELPTTPTAITGGGGKHYYFRYTQTDVKNSTGKLGTGLDIRAEGGYVVSPPSVHQTGQEYRWMDGIGPNDVPMASPPQWMLSLLQKVDSNIISTEESVTEGQRHTFLASIGGKLLKTGLSSNAINSALITENYTKCSPPLPKMEVTKLSEDLIARYSEPQKTSSLKLISPEQWLDEPIKETEWIVDGLIPSSALTMISSPPKVGKSTFARAISASVASGTNFLQRNVKRGGVFYLAMEENPDQVKAAFRKLKIDRDTNILIHFGRPGESLMDELESAIILHKPNLVVIDTLIRLSPKDINMGDYNAISKWIEPLMYTAHASDTSICLIYHDRKDGSHTTGHQALESVLGSTSIGAIIDQLISLRPKDDETRSYQTIGRYKDIPETFYGLDSGTLNLVDIGTSEQLSVLQLEKKITDLLLEKGDMTQGELRENLGVRFQYLIDTLKNMVNKQTIQENGKGKAGNPFLYSLP